MYKRKTILIAVVLLMLLSGGILKAQSGSQAIKSEQAWQALDKIYGLDQRLVSGRSYPGEAQGSIVGNPFWIDSEWKFGSVRINDVLFSGLLLRYDISENKLVLNTSNLSRQSIQVCLNMSAISEFLMDGRKFIEFPGDRSSGDNKFCELCSEGTISYIVTRNKSITIANSSSSDFRFKELVGNYLLLDDRLIPYKNKRTLYKLYPEHKKELKRFIYQNAISFSRANTANRTLLVNYCNTLIDQS